jgi:hypothetical protein
MSNWMVEFSHFESAIPDVFLKAPWQDHSWHNDACPSFARKFDGTREIHVFVDEEDKAKRWDAPDCPRYSVYTTDAEGSFEHDKPCFMADSLEDTLAHVQGLIDAAYLTLTETYRKWRDEQAKEGHPVPEMSADEALLEVMGDTAPSERPDWQKAQIEWLTDYCNQWEAVEARH